MLCLLVWARTHLGWHFVPGGLTTLAFAPLSSHLNVFLFFPDDEIAPAARSSEAQHVFIMLEEGKAKRKQ